MDKGERPGLRSWLRPFFFLVLSLFISGPCFVVALLIPTGSDAVILFMGGLFAFLLLTVPAFLEFREKWERRTGSPPPFARIEGDRIIFHRYPLRHASIRGREVVVTAEQISCVFSSLFDVAFVRHGREVIFLPHELQVEFDAFVAHHRIPRPKLDEAWMLLAEPYIDQPYESEDSDDARLEALRISRAESRQLRRQIRFAMLSATYFTLEWGGYSTRDVLRAMSILNPLRYTRHFYWQVMEVALRGYETTLHASEVPPHEDFAAFSTDTDRH